jgi:hypothetical protein
MPQGLAGSRQIGEKIMARMTDEEANALDELWTKTTPEIDTSKPGFLTRKGFTMVSLDPVTAAYLQAEAVVSHHSSSEIIGETDTGENGRVGVGRSDKAEVACPEPAERLLNPRHGEASPLKVSISSWETPVSSAISAGLSPRLSFSGLSHTYPERLFPGPSFLR